jgi:uncharacterized protein
VELARSTSSWHASVRTGGSALAEEELHTLWCIYSAIQARDPVELRRRLAHDFELSLPEGLPWGGTRHGPEGVESVAEVFVEHVDGAWADPDDFLDAGERVVVLGRARGRARATGVEFEVPFAHVWALRDEVPSTLHAYFDPSPILEALQGSSSSVA